MASVQGHLNAAALDRAFLRPLALITDADNALHNPPDNRSARDKELLDSVVSTLRNGGALLWRMLLWVAPHMPFRLVLSQPLWRTLMNLQMSELSSKQET